MSDEQTQGNGGDSEEQTLTLEEALEKVASLETALKAANSEAAQRRHKLKDFEAAEQKRLEAELSERDLLAKQLADEKLERAKLSKQLQTQAVRSAVMEAATKLGFANPEDAYKLVVVEASVEIADDGSVKGFEKSLEALAKSGRLVMGSRALDLGTPTSTQQRYSGPKGEAKEPIPKIRV